MRAPSCRLCGSPLDHVVVDLGMTPLANAFLRYEELGQPETYYPLQALVCDRCFLVQVQAYEAPEKIFADYAYFSSYSTSWLEHCERYANRMITDLDLDGSSFVVEVASNDGYLLRFFQQRAIGVLGIEPARNIAAVAEADGIPTRVEFFGLELAKELAAQRQPDLIIGNNVLAHVPDLNDFVAGLKEFLSPEGLITIEVPHLLKLIAEHQFDTIYHEHFSYFSLVTLKHLFDLHGLRIADVEELPTHGGSLRLHVVHSESTRKSSGRLDELVSRETAAGLLDLATYQAFGMEVQRVKRDMVRFFVEQKDHGARIGAYGAAAKGNTLLNYCGLGRDFIDFAVDRNPHKQGLYLPGTHIPILPPEELEVLRPDLVFILPWNLREEIVQQMSSVRDWNGRLVVRTPRLTVLT